MVCLCYRSKKFGSTDSEINSKQAKEKQLKQTEKKILIWSFIAMLAIILLIFTLIWVAIPISFMLSVPFQTFMVFIPIDSPRNPNFDRPEDFELQGVHNFHLPTQDYYDTNTWTTIGAWLILPENEIDFIKTTDDDVFKILQNTQHEVLIYLHGVLANRASAIEQYRVLRKHFLIVAIDHRGYGDSGTNVRMSEAGITNDHVQIYDWVRTARPKNDIYYWGHSLGSGLSARTLRLLKEQRGVAPKGLVLESPFTTLQDVVETNVIGRVFNWLAYFEATILKPLDRNGFHFHSKENILYIDCPVMILHAEDDLIVPYVLGEKLAKIAQENRRSDQGEVFFHGIPEGHGLGHNDITLHPRIEEFITNFQTVCRNFNSTS